jgi:hypothetical protein
MTFGISGGIKIVNGEKARDREQLGIGNGILDRDQLRDWEFIIQYVKTSYE